MQISFIYCSNPIGDRSISEWVSLRKKNEIFSYHSAAGIPQARFGELENAVFAIVYPFLRSHPNH
jgi:hypothetical protein